MGTFASAQNLPVEELEPLARSAAPAPVAPAPAPALSSVPSPCRAAAQRRREAGPADAKDHRAEAKKEEKEEEEPQEAKPCSHEEEEQAKNAGLVEDRAVEGVNTIAPKAGDSPGACTSEEDSMDEEDSASDLSDESEPSAGLGRRQRLLGPRRRPPFEHRQTLLFIDWDDTVMPTYWLFTPGGLASAIQGPKRRMANAAVMAKLVEHAKEMLLAAKELGKVVIVTNALTGWVERSCRDFAPELIPVLEGVPTISARGFAEDDLALTNEPNGKAKVFRMEAEDYFRDLPTCMWRNVISIGDSLTEYEALRSLPRVLPWCRAKAVKLIEKPEAADLMQEHKLLKLHLPQVVAHDDSCRFDLAA